MPRKIKGDVADGTSTSIAAQPQASRAEPGDAPAIDLSTGQPSGAAAAALAPVAQIAQSITDELAERVRQATETAAMLEQIRTAGQTDRIAAGNILRGIIDASPDILGVSAVWQPDAYDGRDADFATTDLQNPDTGQFAVYWARGDDGVIKQAKVNLTKLVAKGSWMTPLTTSRAYVTEPYAFAVAGTPYIAATISVPILDPTGVAPGPLGVYSIDVPLHSVAAGLRSGTLPKNVRIILVNRNNILAADSDPAWQPGTGFEVPGEPFASYLIESRGDPTMKISIEWTNREYELAVAPVLFNADQRIWRLMMLTEVK